MTALSYISLALCLALSGYYTFNTLSEALSRRSRLKSLAKQHQCKPIQKKYPHWDPFLGIDLFIKSAIAAWQHQYIPAVMKRQDEMGDTYQLNMLGTVGIMTRDPEIVKAVLSTRFRDFTLDDDRKRAFKPLLGNGIFATDGASWAHSRAMLRPVFTKAQLAELGIIEKHVMRFIDRIPNGETVDIQELAFLFTMDVATDFLMGESTNGLLTNQGEQLSVFDGFADSVQYVQDRVAMHLALGRWALLKPDFHFEHHVQHLNKVTYAFIDKALKEHRPESKSQYYVLLEALVEDVKDREDIRDAIVNILVAGRDTTGCLISNMFFLLSRHPEHWARLQEDVRFLNGNAPDYDELMKCNYVRWTVHESLRILPPVPINSRVSIADTVIPRGGGPDGQSPMVIPKGMPVVWNILGVHLRKDIYGEDADTFRPSRWEGRTVTWEFLPFNGGPRTFASIESMDSRPWKEKIKMATSSLHGVNVSLKRYT